MIVGRMAAPLHSLGPGNRVVIWLQGCSRHCSGCISPELQPFGGTDIDEHDLLCILQNALANANCDGLTVSGGEPFEQPEALERLLRLARPYFKDILVYTGYSIEAIRAGECGMGGIRALGYVDVLIDGPYVDQLNTADCVLRGSENQKIHFLSPEHMDKYRDYLSCGRVVESYLHDGKLYITGIMNRGV